MGATDAEIQAEIAGLASRLDSVTTQADLDALQNDITTRLDTLENNLNTSIDNAKQEVIDDVTEQLEALGKTDEEIKNAIDGISEQLDSVTTQEDLDALQNTITTQLDTISGQITDIDKRVAELQGQGKDQTEALTQAIAEAKQEVIDDLTTKLDALGKSDEEIKNAIDGISEQLDSVTTQEDLDALQNTITTQLDRIEDNQGTISGQVTNLEDQIIARIDALEAQNVDRDIAVTLAIEDLAGQLGVDVDTILAQLDTNQQGVLDRFDVQDDTNQENYQGVLDRFDEQDVTNQGYYNDIISEFELQEQINQENFQQASAANTLNNLIGIAGSPPRTHTSTTPDPIRINYQYDVFGDNIFATDQQAALFGSPYGKGQTLEQQEIATRGVPIGGRVGFGGFTGAAGGVVKNDFNDEIARIMSFGDS